MFFAEVILKYDLISSPFWNWIMVLYIISSAYVSLRNLSFLFFFFRFNWWLLQI